MNIVYTFDDGYSSVTAVSIKSLLETNKSVKDLKIFIVDCGISNINIENFKDLANEYNREIYFVNGKGYENKIPVKLDLLYWSFVCYVRLFFSDIFPCLDKVLHIDCDTLVLDSLEKLYESDLEGNYCGACYDCIPTSKYACGMNVKDRYYSNGLILFDLKRMRDDNIQDKFINYIVESNGVLPHLDQDVLNNVLKNKIYTFNCRYNIMTQNAVFGSKSCEFYEKLEPYYSKSDMEKGIQNPAVIHFVGFRYVGKPWSQPCYHPYNDQWLYYYDLISNSFDPKCNTIKKKKKKYGLFREII
mgnify:FL=1